MRENAKSSLGSTAEVEICGAHRPAWGFAGWLFAALAFTIGFIGFPLRILGTNFEYLPGDPIDNRLNNYVLEHGYRCLTGRAESFWDAPMFYPTAGVTSWSDAHLGMLPFYTAMRASGLSPERAFQGHFVLCFVLNYAAALWALRRLGFGPVGSAVGAYVFSFALPLSSQLQHTQLYARFFIPLAVVFAWEFLLTPRTWRITAVAWCWALQIYLSVYLGFFLAILIGVGTVVALVRFRRELHWTDCRPGLRECCVCAANVGISLAAVLWLAQHHRSGGSEVTVEHVQLFAPKPGAWITPPSNAGAYLAMADWTQLGTAMPNSAEQQLFPGLLPLLAVVFGSLTLIRPGRLGSRRSGVAVAASASLLIGLAFTQYQQGTIWPYERFAGLPGVNGIRAIGRVVLVLLFPSAIVVASCSDWLIFQVRGLGRPAAWAAALLILSGVAADQRLSRPGESNATAWGPMRYPVAEAVARQERIAAVIRQRADCKLLYVFPSAGDGSGGLFALQLEAMRASQDCGISCINGWSGHKPAGWRYFASQCELTIWLASQDASRPEMQSRLVIVGVPEPDPHSFLELMFQIASSDRN